MWQTLLQFPLFVDVTSRNIDCSTCYLLICPSDSFSTTAGNDVELCLLISLVYQYLLGGFHRQQCKTGNYIGLYFCNLRLFVVSDSHFTPRRQSSYCTIFCLFLRHYNGDVFGYCLSFSLSQSRRG